MERLPLLLRPFELGFLREKLRVHRGLTKELVVRYTAPCGKRLVAIGWVRAYLIATGARLLTIDCFTFDLKWNQERRLAFGDAVMKVSELSQEQDRWR